MGDEMGRLNTKWRAEAETAGRPFEEVAIGIAVNSGECCVGNLGSDRHFDYSAIGDPVNITARLQDLTKAYGLTLLVGEETVRRAPDFLFVEVDLVRLRGRKAPSRVFTLLSEGAAPAPEHARFLMGRGAHAAFKTAQVPRRRPGAALRRLRGKARAACAGPGGRLGRRSRIGAEIGRRDQRRAISEIET
jgi:adenylate cyclase